MLPINGNHLSLISILERSDQVHNNNNFKLINSLCPHAPRKNVCPVNVLKLCALSNYYYYYCLNVNPNLIGLCLFVFFFLTDCTQAGLFKLACSRSLPFWWDDVADFDTLEAIAVQTFNQVDK